MAGWKRKIYGHPALRAYRDFRTRQLASRFRNHPAGFSFSGRDAYFDPDWETAERGVVLDQLGRASVFIDVGANQGVYTCMAAAKGLEVACVEPEPGNLRFLLANLARNKFNVEVNPVAVSDRPGIAPIFGDGDMASLVAGWNGISQNFLDLIAMNTLDNLFAHRWPDKTIFIKMDVEGFEFPALQGATKLLDRNPKPSWLIETFPDPQISGSRKSGFRSVFELMFDRGYQAYRAGTNTSVTMDDVEELSSAGSPGVDGSNFLFIPKENS